MRATSRSSRLRSATRWLGVVVGVATCFALAQGARAAWAEYQCSVPRRGAVARPAEETMLATARDAELTTADGQRVRGWFVPGTNRAAVILAHGSCGDRRDVLAEARVLARLGYSVLLYDHPGHGESEGAIDWVRAAPAALRAAVTWVSAQPEVDAARIGALGSSMGATVVTDVASRDARIAGAVLQGCFTDAREQTRYEYRKWGLITQMPALWVNRARGIDLGAMRPIDRIAAIAPRPILLIAGEADTLVPSSMARELHAAAGAPKELWVMAGVGHGGYEAAAPDVYAQRVGAFFAAALSPTSRAPASSAAP